jgi:hypothetical protein
MAVVALAATITTVPARYQQRKTRGGRKRGEQERGERRK